MEKQLKYSGHKFVIYQAFVRYFGNRNRNNVYYGSLDENGCGKFNDFTVLALEEIKKLGVDYIWFTGVLEHATMTDYTRFGIKMDDPDVVKGRAGSPYAVKDYYDVSPDLAENVANRMGEFEALVERVHAAGMKVLIDFVPNHVARTYNSDQTIHSVQHLGVNDNTSLAFHPENDFYYLVNSHFEVPAGYDPGGSAFQHPLKDGKFEEFPAKATGNDVFSHKPSIHDWFETIKLNYGVDYESQTKHFHPTPPVWTKLREILLFWAGKGVDGFRCDMAEMVPVEFWHWLITGLKKKYPELIFIAEAYDKNVYRNLIVNGKFDYLYDKVGFYDLVKALIRNDENVDTNDFANLLLENEGIEDHLLRFLENHDEIRIASPHFAGNPWLAVPAMVLAATWSTGPVMIYNGQELAESAIDAEGFSGDDGRSSIFDYWGIASLQNWMNGGKFDGGGLSEEQKMLRSFYEKLLQFTRQSTAIRNGKCIELSKGNKTYAYLRQDQTQKLLIVLNFNRYAQSIQIPTKNIHFEHFAFSENTTLLDMLSQTPVPLGQEGDCLNIQLPSTSAVILQV